MTALSGNFPKLPQIDDRALNILVFTHSSWKSGLLRRTADDEEPESHERLARLGDPVLASAIMQKLYHEIPHMSGTELSLSLQHLHSKQTLARWADNYRLPERLRCSPADKEQLMKDDAVKAQLFRAYVGAVFERVGHSGVIEWIHPLIETLSPFASSQIAADEEPARNATRPNGVLEVPNAHDDRESIISGSSFTSETESSGEDELASSMATLELLNRVPARSETSSEGTITPASSPTLSRHRSQALRMNDTPPQSSPRPNLTVGASSPRTTPVTVPPTSALMVSLINGRNPLAVLNELVAQNKILRVTWKEPVASGPSHVPEWSIALVVDGRTFTSRYFCHKQTAKAEAASLALQGLGFY